MNTWEKIQKRFAEYWDRGSSYRAGKPRDFLKLTPVVFIYHALDASGVFRWIDRKLSK